MLRPETKKEQRWLKEKVMGGRTAGTGKIKACRAELLAQETKGGQNSEQNSGLWEGGAYRK